MHVGLSRDELNHASISTATSTRLDSVDSHDMTDDMRDVTNDMNALAKTVPGLQSLKGLGLGVRAVVVRG
jgi:hypothetical protein